jgi:anti-sigma factor RsiW
MNPSGPESYEDLVSALLEGDLDEPSAAVLESLLREDPARAQALLADLDFADRFEQALIPNRSVGAFLNGLETRFHAEAPADVFLDDVTVSRHHADIRRGAQGWSIRDAGSLNGTYINRKRVEDHQLGGGDEIQIGKFRFVFLVGVETGP